MHADHVFKVVDLHSGGAPGRLVLSGVPTLKGRTVMDKMHDFAANHDWIRRALVLEPRGRGLTSAIVLLPPSRPDADVGAFFMEAHGYLPMCGSDTIATVTALIETGQIVPAGESTTVRIDTPAGLVEATAAVSSGRVTGVTFLSAPAFCLVPQTAVTVPGIGEVVVDISYGGNFYAIADARQLGLVLSATTTDAAVAVAERLRDTINDTIEVAHPELPSVRGVTHVQLFEPASEPSRPTKVMVIMPRGLVDRSPCGTGTTAKVATLFAQGRLELGQSFVHRSITGASYTGRPVEECRVGAHPACRVAITGSAFVTADATVYLDSRDELAAGFQL